MLRWLGRNLGTMLLAFLLALVVWVSALLATDPNEEAVYPTPLQIEKVGLDPALVIIDSSPSETQITLIAPRSIWARLLANPGLLKVWVDLSGLEAGEHLVPIQTQISLTPARAQQVEPPEVRVVLEKIASRPFSVNLDVSGEPALGYRKGTPVSDPDEVIVSGPESIVSQVVAVRTVLDASGADATIEVNLPVKAYNETGEEVTGITIYPSTISVSQPITLLGGYRNVVVKVVTRGQVADGYWLTNMSVTPPNVTVFSTNPQQVISLPGYVETIPIDLTGLNDDIDVRAALSLPEGVTLAGEESVLVRMSIAALEGSLPILIPIEVVGLSPELEALVSPESVDLLLIGPLPILNNLNPGGIRVSVNVAGLEPGFYQIMPVVDLLPSQVQVASILPEEVEVRIQIAPTATPTPRVTQSAQATPTP